MINQRLFNSTQHLAKELSRQLSFHKTRIVFAESCTAGLVSAILAQVPGISNWLCGSAVTYQECVKEKWLDIDAEILAQHTAVSAQVTQKMAENVLKKTPAADFSVAITGHLDQTATPLSPCVFVGLGFRKNNCILTGAANRYPLKKRCRIDRQWESARFALNAAVQHLHFPPKENPNTVDWYRVCSEPVSYHWDPWI